MSKAVGVIPARWNSSRFPGKPLHPIAGKPLLRRVWERTQSAQSLDQVVIATDDMRIAEAAFDWGAEVALTASRHRSGTDRIAEIARRAPDWSFVVNIQGDEPLLEPKVIDRMVDALRQNRQMQLITAAHPFEAGGDPSSPHQVKVVIDRDNTALYFSRRAIPFCSQGSSVPRYLRHQGIYAYRRALLLRFVTWKPSPLERAESLEQLRALENGVRIHVVVTGSGSPGVDTPEDAERIERQLLSVSRPSGSRNRLQRA